MITLSQMPTRIVELSCKGSVDTNEGTRPDVRLKLEIDITDWMMEEEGFLQDFESKAVASIVEGSRVQSEEEGPNTYLVKVKRRFDVMWYKFKRGNATLDLEASIPNASSPVIKVVEGLPTLVFKIHGRLDSNDAGKLMKMINVPDVTLTTSNPQIELLDAS